MSSLETTINDRPVTVEYNFWPGCPMRVTGTGFGDADPEEYDDVEVTSIISADGYNVILWVGEADMERIENEIIAHERENGRAAA